MNIIIWLNNKKPLQIDYCRGFKIIENPSYRHKIDANVVKYVDNWQFQADLLRDYIMIND